MSSKAEAKRRKKEEKKRRKEEKRLKKEELERLGGGDDEKALKKKKKKERKVSHDNIKKEAKKQQKEAEKRRKRKGEDGKDRSPEAKRKRKEEKKRKKALEKAAKKRRKLKLQLAEMEGSTSEKENIEAFSTGFEFEKKRSEIIAERGATSPLKENSRASGTTNDFKKLWEYESPVTRRTSSEEEIFGVSAASEDQNFKCYISPVTRRTAAEEEKFAVTRTGNEFENISDRLMAKTREISLRTKRKPTSWRNKERNKLLRRAKELQERGREEREQMEGLEAHALLEERLEVERRDEELRERERLEREEIELRREMRIRERIKARIAREWEEALEEEDKQRRDEMRSLGRSVGEEVLEYAHEQDRAEMDGREMLEIAEIEASRRAKEIEETHWRIDRGEYETTDRQEMLMDYVQSRERLIKAAREGMLIENSRREQADRQNGIDRVGRAREWDIEPEAIEERIEVPRREMEFEDVQKQEDEEKRLHEQQQTIDLLQQKVREMEIRERHREKKKRRDSDFLHKVLEIPKKDIKMMREETEEEDDLFGPAYITLGEGGYGVVYKCEWLRQEKKEIVAMKVLNLDLDPDTVEKEVHLVQMLRHPQVVKVFGFVQLTRKKVGIVMELMECSLSHVIFAECGVMSVATQINIALQMITAVEFLHSRGVVHRDIKPANFLMSLDHKCVKIADFGLARVKMNSMSVTGQGPKGTARYMAKELYLGHPLYSEKSDVFALGMCFFELFTGELSFPDAANELSIMGLIKGGEGPSIPSDLPQEFKKVIEWCIGADPADRPSSKVLLEHMESIQERLLGTKAEAEPGRRRNSFASVYQSICEKIGDVILGDYDWSGKRLRIGQRGMYYGENDYAYKRLSETVYSVTMEENAYLMIYILEDNVLKIVTITEKPKNLFRTDDKPMVGEGETVAIVNGEIVFT